MPSVGAELARDGNFETAIAGKPCSHKDFCLDADRRLSPIPSVGAKLARDGDFEIAIAGKPCSYRFGI
ncbi:hypothetical protein C9I49_26440 [Pseudomonas prosekii]|uniref:Uncharacterized protein n=1 Tax=Pseudomonas prosekii TaxID=1148509 RepID=A0A2U2D0Q6_9PSED|nr:hypothetical protein C9I49_26440 [Pseudomonas prosekii]